MYYRPYLNSPTLTSVTFDTTEELEDYVKKFDYAENKLCFALAWNEFDSSTHTYSFDVRMNFGDVLSTRLPQSEYEESLQNQLYLPQYANSGFLQIMNTATTKLLSDQYGESVKIQLAYMPMNSEEFRNDGFAETLGALIPLSIYTLINLTAFMSSANEEKV